MALKLVVMLLLVWQGVGAATYRAGRLGWGAAGSFPPPWEQHQWTMAGTPPSTSTVRLVLALTKQPGGETRLTEALLAASTPSSARYGTWLSRDQVRGMVAHTQCPDHVTAWLRRQAGVSEAVVGGVGDTVRVTLTVKATEALFSTTLATFMHVATGVNAVRARAGLYGLPPSLSRCVEFVHGLGDLPSPTTATRARHHLYAASWGHAVNETRPCRPLTQCVRNETSHEVECFHQPVMCAANLEWWYNFTTTTTTTTATRSPSVAVGELAAFTTPASLDTFTQQSGVPAVNVTFTGVPNTGSAECLANATFAWQRCAEASLDVDVVAAVARGANVTYVNAKAGDWLGLATALQALPPPTAGGPQAVSISWSQDEQHFVATGSTAYASFVCDKLKQIAATGVSVFVASGDNGAIGSYADVDPSKCGFHVQFPASCPWVTAVGATQFLGVHGMGHGQRGCSTRPSLPLMTPPSAITSGGGFSTVFKQPAYQAAAVQPFVANTAAWPPATATSNQTLAQAGPNPVFWTGGRAVPDVSALGNLFPVRFAASWHLMSGTSAATPVWAGLVTQLNAQRQQRGQSSLGFLNPLLYELAASADATPFVDITEGENGCGEGGTCCSHAWFKAVAGFDAMTGLGTPDFPKLAELLAV